MNTPLRRVGLAMLAMIVLLLANATYIQVVKADDYRNDPRNQRVLLAEYARKRGQISAGGQVLAKSVETGARDPGFALFATLVALARERLGWTPETSFADMIGEMVEADLALLSASASV